MTDQPPSARRISDTDLQAYGIQSRSSVDSGWATAPAQLTKVLATATDTEPVLGTVLSLPPKTQQLLLHPRSGVLAMILPLDRGTRVLEIASASGAMTAALMHCGAEVTRVDWCLSRLKFAQLMHEPRPLAAVHVSRPLDVAGVEGLFDVITLELDQVLLEAGQAPVADVLSRLTKTLQPDGVLVISVARGVLRRAKGPGRTGTAWLVSAAEGAGLVIASHWAHLPTSGGSYGLLPLAEARRALRRRRPTTGMKGKFLSAVKAAVARAGGADRLVSTHVLVLTRPGADHGPSVVDRMDLASNPHSARIETLSDDRALVRTASTVAKVPLSSFSEAALAREVSLTQAVRATALSSFVVPEAEMKTVRGIAFARFSFVAHRSGRDLAASRAALVSFLNAQEGQLRELADTALMHRLSSPRGVQDTVDIGAQPLLARAHELAATTLSCGITHGDLHAGNVLLATAGHPILVDWNRGELINPLLLDAVYACLKDHQRSQRASLAQATRAFLLDRIEGELAEIAARLAMPLSRADAVALVMLDRVASYSRPRRRYKPWTMPELASAVAVACSSLPR